ncbi:MAG: variant-type mycofactocin precursor [Syntrophomonas sp.]
MNSKTECKDMPEIIEEIEIEELAIDGICGVY